MARLSVFTTAKFIFIDGLPSQGKSFFGRILSDLLSLQYVDTDDSSKRLLEQYVTRTLGKERPSYVDCIDREHLLSKISPLSSAVIAGSCLNLLFPQPINRNECRIYLSKAPILFESAWTLPPNDHIDYRKNPNRSILLYHKQNLPHRKADIMLIRPFTD